MAENKKKTDNWPIFKIRTQLLKIWFLKNLSLFIRVTFFIIAVLFIFGVIQPSSLVAQIIGLDQLEIEKIEDTNDAQTLIAGAISTLISVLYFMKKSKSIALEDIKSRELKIALIKAKLYFDEDGRLCKRIEEQTQLDINGDGKVGDTNISELKSESIISGTKNAIGELTTILTTKIDLEDKVVEESQLNEKIEESANVITTEKLYTEMLGAPEVEADDDEKSLEEKLQELNIELSQEEAEEIKLPEKKKKQTFFGEIFRVLRLIFTPTKETETFTDKTHRRKRREKKLDIESIETSKVEVIKDENTEETFIDIPLEHKENEEKALVVKEAVKEITTTEQKPMTAKEKQINDILQSI